MKRLIRTTALLLAAAAIICLSGCNRLQQLIGDSDRNTELESRTESAAQSRFSQLEQDGADYGYKALKTDAERRVYSMLDAYVGKGVPQMFVVDNDGTPEKMTAIIELYKSDHPEVFWLNDQYSYEYVTYSDYTEITPLFSVDQEALETARNRFDEAVDKILADAPVNGSDYEKELYVNEYLISHCFYDEEAAKKEEVVANEQNAYGAIIDGKAVCEGYTRAFQLLCERLGIDCVPINGTCDNNGSGEPGNHIWNAVKISGDWYYVDATWNDFQPVTEDYKVTDIERHQYFNITTEQLLRDHTINDVYGSEKKFEYYNAIVPECTATEYNYFNKEFVTLSDPYNCDDLLAALAKAASNQEEAFEFRVSENVDYDETMQTIINGAAYEWFSYSNSVNDEDCQLTDDCKIYSYQEMNVAAIGLAYSAY